MTVADVQRPALPRGRLSTLQLPASSRLDAHVYVPSRVDPVAPLVVSVHGVSQNAEEHARLLASAAERRGVVVLAPIFDAQRFGGYQRLAVRERPPDLHLLDLMELVAHALGISVARSVLFGFSGGGQFAHRFALVHPGRVAQLLVASAGWYTFPDRDAKYPEGTARGPRYQHVACRLKPFLRIPTRVFVGALDDQPDPVLNSSASINRRQGSHRVERARRWVAALEVAARERRLPVAARLEILPGVGHSFADCVALAGLDEKIIARV